MKCQWLVSVSVEKGSVIGSNLVDALKAPQIEAWAARPR